MSAVVNVHPHPKPMKFVIKYPTRGRPQQFLKQIPAYRALLSGEHSVRFVISIDEDDPLMVNEEMGNYLRGQADCQVFVGRSKSKVEAINADFDKLGDYDVLILASDDMIPTTQHYDVVLADLMTKHFPAMDGCLHFSDGFNPRGLNTMPIAGKRLLDHWGWVYHPEYVSEYCDDWFQAVTERDGKSYRDARVLFHHQWCSPFGKDATFKRNQGFSRQDKATFDRHKAAGFPLGGMTI